MTNNLSRRGIVRSAPAAVLAASLSALTGSPFDAELVDLAARFDEAATLHDDLCEQCDDVYSTVFAPPPMPEALLWRRDDQRYICADPRSLEDIEIEGRSCYTYDTAGIAERLTACVARWKTVANPLLEFDQAVIRAEEILAALKAYKAEETQRLAACGYTAVSDACDRQVALIADLEQRIAATPARAPEGVGAKARVALRASCRNAGALVQELLAKAERLPRESIEMLALSALIDAARLGAPSRSSERRAAA